MVEALRGLGHRAVGVRPRPGVVVTVHRGKGHPGVATAETEVVALVMGEVKAQDAVLVEDQAVVLVVTRAEARVEVLRMEETRTETHMALVEMEMIKATAKAELRGDSEGVRQEVKGKIMVSMSAKMEESLNIPRGTTPSSGRCYAGQESTLS